jgi:hypothetical protein
MNDDDKPLTKKDFIEALRELDEGPREYVHDTETRILKAFHVFSTTNELRLGQLEEFGAASGKRLAIVEAAGRLAELELRVAEIEKKLDRRQ